MASKAGRAVAAIVGVAVALASAGCSVRAQMAYSIDGAVTTIAQVSEMYNSCLAATTGTEYTEDVQSRVREMIMADLGRRVASAEGIDANDDALRAQLESGDVAKPQLKVMLNDQKCSELAVSLVLYGMVLSQIGAEKLTADIAGHAVVVNPRFGTWNPIEAKLERTGSMSQEGLSSAG